jgi:sigma-B regulation protein RsbU (phosphoserine phosphatase)
VSAVVMGVTLQRIYLSATNALLEQHLQEVSLLARSIDNELSSLARVADDTAGFLSIHADLQEDELYAQLRTNVRSTPMIFGAALAFEPYVFKANQRLFAPYVYDGDLKAIDISVVAYDYTNGNWDWYSRVRNSGQSGWSEPYFTAGSGDYALTTYSTPLLRDDVFIGVATVDLRLDELSREIASQLIDQRFMVMSPTGRFVAHFDPSLTSGSGLHELAQRQTNPGFVSVADDILAGKTGFSVLRGLVLNGAPESGNVWIFHTPIANTGWYLAAFTSEAQLMESLLDQIQIALLGMSLTVLLIFVLVWLVSSRLTRPLKLLEAAVSDVARGKLDTQIQNIRSMDEIGRLSIGFNRMLKNLKKQIELQSHQETAQKVLEREMEMARETQRALLPSEFPPFPERKEFELHAVSQAAMHVAGDFFDFFLVTPKTLCLVIADVSGKGMSAALVMAVTRTIIRDLAKSGSSPADILRETNERLRESQRGSAFVTVFLGFYQIGNGRLIYANGGHPPPWLVTRHGQVQSVGEATGTIVGMLEQQTWRNAELRLQPGEMLVLYTDGFYEARSPSGEFYGSGRIRNFLGMHAQATPTALCEAVVREVGQFQQGNLADDLTLLALRRNPGGLTSFFRTN